MTCATCLRQKVYVAVCALALAALSKSSLMADDWPTYQHDIARSGMTSEQPQLPLAEAWSHRSAVPPQPAWDEPATWDGWNKVFRLKNRVAFDKALHVIVVGDTVYYGSSVDDQIYAVDAKTRDIRWRFYTEGPVRLAPTFAEGRLYAGSDDGHVYCLAPDNGKLIWAARIGPRDYRVPGSGRIVSLWPVRTNIAVVDGVAYCAAGVLPSQQVYVTALDAASGEQLWQTPLDDQPAQGYLLASRERLYVTTGRGRPLVFDRKHGERLHSASGGTGGTYALLADDMLVYGPNKTGQVSALGSEGREELASFDGNHMIVTPMVSYLHTDRELSALDRARYLSLTERRAELAREKRTVARKLDDAEGKEAEELAAESKRLSAELDRVQTEMQSCILWRAECAGPLSLILAGNTLFAGGSGLVVAHDAQSGRPIWSGPVSGNAYGLAFANGQLYVSTDLGTIHCFAPTDETNVEADDLAAQLANAVPPTPGPFTNPTARPTPDIVGPIVEPLHGGRARVTWHTPQPTTSLVEVGRDEDRLNQYGDEELKNDHAVECPLPADVEWYRLRAGGSDEAGEERMTELFEIDRTLSYLPPPAVSDATQTSESPSSSPIEGLFTETGTSRGYALVLGAGDGHVAEVLARHSDLHVVVVEEDADQAQNLRERLTTSGIYGHRICVLNMSIDALPFGPYLANVIVPHDVLRRESVPELADAPSNFMHMLRPSGGMYLLGIDNHAIRAAATALADTDGSLEIVNVNLSDHRFIALRRGPLPGAGEWTHQYAAADNTACSHDARVAGELGVLWWGRPGSRAMPDRGPRNPAPLYAAGRLYVQGNRTLFGIDAYNGTILWFRQVPTLRRANMPRDGSNMVAAGDVLYLAMGDHAVALDGATGRRLNVFSAAEPNGESSVDWGFLAHTGEHLVGTACVRGAQYLGDRGEWYDDTRASKVARVTSRRLFVIDPTDGSEAWSYSRGAIVNSTITIADGVVYFIESRDPAAMDSDSGRLHDELLGELHLVALDLADGHQRWERPYDFSRCENMLYLAASSGRLVATGSDSNKEFHIYGFDAADGEELWQQHAPAKKLHHSGHLSHPVIVGQRVYVNKHMLDLASGEVLEVSDFDWHGCGTAAASQGTLFRRYEYHGMLDLASGQRTEMLGVRSGCWLNLIPAGGLLLAPESSAGCSCSHAVQTSVAYVPLNDHATQPAQSDR